LALTALKYHIKELALLVALNTVGTGTPVGFIPVGITVLA
jgi:hypothetical protein